MRSSSRPGKSGASQAPQAHTTRSASRRRPSSRTTAAPSGRASASTSSAPAATACAASVLTASRARRIPASGSKSVKRTSSTAMLGNSSLASTRSHGIPSARRTASPAASQPSSRCASQATPESTTRSGSISCHSAQARRAERVCHASGPWQQRMMRDSSPEPARTWPGATRSTSTTSQPANAQWRASDAPNTPAPTTTSEGRLLIARRLDGHSHEGRTSVFPRPDVGRPTFDASGRVGAPAAAQCLTRRVLEVAVDAL